MDGPGSFIEIGGRRWGLVPHVSSSSVEGVRWYLRDKLGLRVNYLLVTPTRLVGSRHEMAKEIGLRYGRSWSPKKRAARKKLKIIRKIEPTFSAELSWLATHDYVPKRKRTNTHVRAYERLVQKLMSVEASVMTKYRPRGRHSRAS
jgi:hypothetical protein